MKRVSIFDRHRTLILSSFLAGHVVFRQNGFRLKDVQFFFYLFSNWLENDRKAKGIEIQLVQIKRLLEEFSAKGLVESIGVKRHKRFSFSFIGYQHLIRRLVSDDKFLTISEIILIQYILTEYRDQILEAISSHKVFISPSELLDFHSLIDPVAFVNRQIGWSNDVIKDLKIRLEENQAMAEYIDEAQREGRGTDEIIKVLTKKFSYQLNARRVLSDVFFDFGQEMMATELTNGFRNRQRLLFRNLHLEFVARVRFLTDMTVTWSSPSQQPAS